MLKKVKEYIKIALDTGFFYIMLSNILNSVFGFISGIIVVRIISKGEYGIYSYANNLLSYFLLVTGLGLSSGTFQICCECNKDKPKMYAAYRYGVSRGLLVNVLLGVCVIIYSRFAEVSIPASRDYLMLMAFLPVATLLLEFAGIYFRSDYRNKEYSVTYTVNAGIVCVFSALGAFLFGVRGIILASYLGPVFSVCIICVFTDLKKRWKAPVLDNKRKKEIWKISLVAVASNAISQLMYLIDVSMIGTYIKNEEVIASYRIGMTIPSALNFIPLVVVTYIYPYFASHINDLKWTRQKYKSVMLGMGMVNFFISAILIIGAPEIVRLVFGEQYLDAVPVFRILSFSYFWQGTFRVIASNLLVTQKRLKFNLVESILTAIVNIVGDYVLISRWQSVGVALATLIVMMFSGILATVYYIYVIRKRGEE